MCDIITQLPSNHRNHRQEYILSQIKEKLMIVAQRRAQRQTNGARVWISIQKDLLQCCEMRMNSQIQIICCGYGLRGDYTAPPSTG